MIPPTPGLKWNDAGNGDGLKHLSGDHFNITNTGTIAKTQRRCFAANRVLTILGDTNHTLRSTVRRFQLKHINTLRRNMGKPPLRNQTDLTVFDLPPDELGITYFQTSWLHHLGKPRFRAETTESLYSHPKEVVSWLTDSLKC